MKGERQWGMVDEIVILIESIDSSTSILVWIRINSDNIQLNIHHSFSEPHTAIHT